MKNSTVSVRVDSELKEQAESILKNLGIPVSTLITSLYRQVIIKQGVPFDITLAPKPKALDQYTNEELAARFQESFRQIERGEVYSVDEVFERLKRGQNNG